ncbi:hypothetical protein [Undibacterium sp.]|uniref:tetratricopeptide repeat protein n=1 Tax=Undibacterium sp. TaxID=1914977 RepID=UPI0025E8C4EC|nr:hypothetical protein [Undibacterium sp.]
MTKKRAETPAATAKKASPTSKISAPAKKQLSNPISTGGAGASYESRVQAVYLLSMYAGLPTAVSPEATIICLQFQAKIHGYETDDLVCTFKDQMGLPYKALLQVKRTAKAIISNVAFSEAITAAWFDFKNPILFSTGVDRLVLVYDGLGNSDLQGAVSIASYARKSLSGLEFFNKSTTEKFSSEKSRGAFNAILEILTSITYGPVHLEEFHQFAKNLWFVSHTLSSDDTPEYANLLGIIELVLGRAIANNAQGIWSELVNTCQKLNADAGSVSFANLDEQISRRIAAGFKLHREGNASSLSLGGLTPAIIQSSSIVDVLDHGASVTHIHALPSSVTATPTEVALSSARPDSLNRVISGQLNAIGEKLKQCHFGDAQLAITAIGKDLGPFDSHQKARWYQQRGICAWHLGSAEDAAADFIKAAELSIDDDKMAAARVRGLMLLKQTEASIVAGETAIERFPESLHVWLSLANAKMLRGDSMELTDAPASIRGEADVLQMLAWSYHFRGQNNVAVEFSLQALQAPAAGFLTRHSALTMVVEAVMNDSVLSQYQLIPDTMRQSLLKVTNALTPRVDKLWEVQAPESVTNAAAYLGYAYLLLGDANTALTIVQEAVVHGNSSPGLRRVELDALGKLGRIHELLERGHIHVTELAADGLVFLAQQAGRLGDYQLLDKCIVAALKIEAIESSVTDTLRAIRWISNLRTPRRTEIISEVKAEKLEASKSFSLLSAGARVFLSSGDMVAAECVISQMVQIVEHSKSKEETLILAELLFEAKKFEQAIGAYEEVLPKNQHSELHNRLLCCYIKTSSSQKAKQLLESFPTVWVEDDDTRSLAIELGQNVGDWKMLTSLADTQFKKVPSQVSSWLFKFMVDIRRKSVYELQQFINDAPLELNGSLQQTTQFAGLELKYGLESKGMQRMYRLRRLDIENVESASALVVSFLAVTERLPHMETDLDTVVPGTSVKLRDQQGGCHTLTIDPAELDGLPPTAEFKSANSVDAKYFIGGAVGSTVNIDGAFGSTRTYTIEAISSGYHRVLQLAFKAIDDSIIPVSNLRSMSIPTSSAGETDFSQMEAELRRYSAHGKQVFTQYETMPLTLGCLCRLLGKNPIDIVRNWPTNGTALISCDGTRAERINANELLEDTSAAFVIDSATLTELVWLDSTAVFEQFPNLYVSAITRDIVRGKLEQEKGCRSAGQAFDNDGTLGFIEYTEENHTREIEQLEAISATLDKYCKVLPAYGPETPNEILVGLKDLISHEEYSSLMLAAEMEAVLVTIDSHLRQWATAAQIRSVWPQILLMHSAVAGNISAKHYSLTTVKLFLANRSFTSLSSNELLTMCYQGDNWLQFGFCKYVRHLSHPNTDFMAAFQICLEFISNVTNSLTQVGAIGEFLKHIVAGLLRHKDCPTDAVSEIDNFLESLIKQHSVVDYYPRAAIAERYHCQQQLTFLKASVREGQTWAKDAEQERKIRVKVLMCGRVPWLIYQKD